MEFGATAGHPLAQQQNFLATLVRCCCWRVMSDFLVAGPGWRRDSWVARSSRKTRCDGWGAMVGTMQRPEERTPAPYRYSHSPQALRLPSVPSHYAASAFSRPVFAPASPMTMRGVWIGTAARGQPLSCELVGACLSADTLADGDEA